MKRIYFDHDGNVDDFVSLLLLLQEPQIDVIGVGVTDGDGYLEPAVQASRKIIDHFNQWQHPLAVAKSDARAHHPFPREWRLGAFTFNQLPLLNESGPVKTKVAPLPAALDMVEKIQASPEPVTVVMTGPISDLALALDADPTIQDKIEALYWMGGSLDGHGNVLEPGFDGSQEWNAFWDPEAVARVWQSGLKIKMIGLESSEALPLNDALRQHFASLRRYPAFDLIGQGYALILNSQTDGYYLWDVLTTLASLAPQITTQEVVNSLVRTDGAAAGRLERNSAGRPVDLVTKADKDAFFVKLDQLAKSAKYY